MESPKYDNRPLGKQSDITAGELKIAEYAKRIVAGEEADYVMQGLPKSWVRLIDEQVNEIRDARSQEDAARRSDLTEIAALKAKYGLGAPAKAVPAISVAELEARKKLSDWSASYKLAQIARTEGVDLAKLSREQYVDYAILHHLKITDTQLRASPWQRMAESVEEVLAVRKKKKSEIRPEVDEAFSRFDHEMQSKAGSANIQGQMLAKGVRVRTGTKDSNSWLFFAINDSKVKEQTAGRTPKSYISLKDLNFLSPERFVDFMKALQVAGYQGDVKIFQDLAGQGLFLNDQIVMHGNTEKDSNLALQVAEQFWKDQLEQRSTGADELIDGKNRSYSEILAMRIKSAVDNS